MKFPLYIVQAILLVLWYAVPALAAVPAWVIWLPTEIVLALLGLTVGLPLACMAIAGIAVGVVSLFEAVARRR